MDALEALVTRRSVRSYAARDVGPESVETLLRAAMNAPSAGDQQPWDFLVVRAKKTLEQIAAIHPHAGMLPGAALGIVVTGDPGREKHRGYWVQDCAAAVENMLIAAHAMGLGAVWLGLYPREDRVDRIRRLLEMPERVVPFAVVSVGYPAEIKGAQDRFDAGKVHLEKWDSKKK